MEVCKVYCAPKATLTAESEPPFSIADCADWMKAPLYRTEAYVIPETIEKLIKPYEHGSCDPEWIPS